MFDQEIRKERMKAANHRMDDLNCEKDKRSIFAFDFINDPRVAAVLAQADFFVGYNRFFAALGFLPDKV